MTLDYRRTPDDAFQALPEFPYEAQYVDDLPGYEGLRMARVDADGGDAGTVLLLHGEPSWSYLYRKMIPGFLETGHRVVAPDWYGFGRSDKPTRDGDYSWDFHHGSLLALVDRLDLRDVTLVVQDWGGLLGLTLPISHPELISRLLIMNTGFNVGSPLGEGFLAWRDYVANTPDLPVGQLLARAEPNVGLSESEVAAYDAPFPDASYKAGVRTFPRLVATEPEAPGAALSREAARWWSTEWSGPTFMAVGRNDPVLGIPVMERMQKLINGCPDPLILDVGHFVPEAGEQIVSAALASWS